METLTRRIGLFDLLPDGTTATALGRVRDSAAAEEVARFLGSVEASSPWWWGDLLNQTELRFGEAFDRMARHSRLDVKTLRNHKWVAAAVPTWERRARLDWSHHAALAGLSTDDRVQWLDWAEQPIGEGEERPRSCEELRLALHRWRLRGVAPWDPPRAEVEPGPGQPGPTAEPPRPWSRERPDQLPAVPLFLSKQRAVLAARLAIGLREDESADGEPDIPSSRPGVGLSLLREGWRLATPEERAIFLDEIGSDP